MQLLSMVTVKTISATVLFSLMFAMLTNVHAVDGVSLTGVWHAKEMDILGNPGMNELTLQPNGRYVRQYSSASGNLITITGTYQVFVDEGILRLNIEQYSPREFCSPLGCTPILFPSGETWQFEMQDHNALFMRMTGCRPGTCPELFYRRIGM